MLYKEKMKQLGVRVSQEDWKRIQEFCEKHCMTTSEFIRYAIAQILDIPTNN